MSVVLSVFLAVFVAHVLSWAYYKFGRNSPSLLGQLQGPKSPSFWIGERWLSKVSTIQIFSSFSFFFFRFCFCARRVWLTMLGVRKRG
jgi:hypothetical protein